MKREKKIYTHRTPGSDSHHCNFSLNAVTGIEQGARKRQAGRMYEQP